MATNQCEAFSNEVKGNNSVSVAVVSYLALQKPYKDSLYDPYCGGVNIHNNVIERGSGGLDNSVVFGQMFAAIFGEKVPDMVYDGLTNPAYLNPDGSLKNDQKVCFRENGNVTFANLDLANKSKNMSTDITKMDCSIDNWLEVKMP